MEPAWATLLEDAGYLATALAALACIIAAVALLRALPQSRRRAARVAGAGALLLTGGVLGGALWFALTFTPRMF